MRVEYHPLIEREIKEVVNHYNQSVEGLGDDFLDEFERQILNIVASPKLWKEVENGVRRSLMRRFPYSIYFRIVNPDLVRVTVVKHQRRHPKYGSSRK